MPGCVTPGNGIVFVERHAGNDACELRPAAVDDAVSIRRIRRAENGERNAAVPEDGSRNLPAVQRMAEKAVLHFRRQFIHVLRVEIVADVVVAGAVVSRQISRKRRQNSARGKLQKAAV